MVAGAIFSSTLTTVCVFLPIVFTRGTDTPANDGYVSDDRIQVWVQSLIVALTLVPSMGSNFTKGYQEQRNINGLMR